MGNEPPKRIRSSGLRLDELRYTSCRYIISAEAAVSIRYCGEDKKRGSYCVFHANLCYIPHIKKTSLKPGEA